MSNQEAIRKRVTDEIVAALKAGTKPWSRPWCDLDNTGLPTNVVSENTYSGVNVLLLMLVGQARGYQSKWWGTFIQWQALGFQVMKRPDNVPAGQYGVRAILFKPVTKTTKDANGNEEEAKFFLLREFVLFNAEQVTGPGIEEYHARPRIGGGFLDYGPAEEVIAATGADIRTGSMAVYHVNEDFIELPPKAAFKHAHGYYSTLAHETIHWSGNEKRLNRLKKLARFGSESYAMEELCAEMGSAFLCSQVGIRQSDDLTNTAAYLSSWLTVLERDINAVFTASTAASTAANFILSFSRGKKEVAQEEASVA
jgi:antirestriction protein ArdC